MDLSTLALEFFVIVFLALLNGVLAMSEMAMVSAKKLRLQQAAQNGSSGARTALGLLDEPSQFLAAIQIGITLIGVFAGAFGGANMAEQLNTMILDIPLLAPYATGLSLGAVVLLVTLLSLILGELVPKRLALGHAEGIAIMMAKPITMLSLFARPAVWFLSAATEGILKLLRYRKPEEMPVTDEEVRILVEQGTQAGVFEREEESIIKRTLRLSDRTVDEVMTNRLHLVCLDLDDSTAENFQKIKASSHSYFPVYQETIDRIIGVVSIKQIFAASLSGPVSDLKPFLQEPLYIPVSMPALKLLEMFKTSGKHFAVVIDEYGGVSGVVTAIDLLESIVGDLPQEHDRSNGDAVQRQDGSWLVDGIIALEEVPAILGLEEGSFFPDDYQTLGGFLMGELGRIPKEADKIYWKNYFFEVIDMDGNRVDKVLISPPKE